MNRKRHLLLPLLLLALGAGTAAAQTLSGTIAALPSAAADSAAAAEPAPLPFATVYLPALRQGAMTDLDGRFRIEGLPAGTYAVEYSCIGYATQRDTVTLGAKAASLAQAIAQAAGGTPSDVERRVVLSEQAIRLPEVVFGSTDENPALVTLRHLDESDAANLRRIASFHASCDDAVAQNIATLPDKLVKALKVMLFVTPYRKIFNLFIEHPELSYAARYDADYDGKKLRQSGLALTRCAPQLDAKETQTLLKIFEDGAVCLDYLTPGKESARHPSQRKKFEWELVGTYEEGGRTVDVVRATYISTSRIRPHADYHIIHLDEDPATATAGVTRALLRVQSRSHTVEFREVAPNLFLPVSDLITIQLSGDMKAELDQALDQRQDSLTQVEMSDRKRAKNDRKEAETRQLLDDLSQVWIKTASSIRYTDVKVKD